ncbi:hypothetical protein Nepgr_012226 [Nepenthes gracilis]|uniref:Uncharacterized protein n=1 Tax=Nepenthes gracilis TaxID=150966 RepID=A0AAD3SFD3_NEPGR|nr:hypothetical protein Nepgr_012226 [Nepenthes gracilis]
MARSWKDFPLFLISVDWVRCFNQKNVNLPACDLGVYGVGSPLILLQIENPKPLEFEIVPSSPSTAVSPDLRMGRKRKNFKPKNNDQASSEDYCFVCKDGGLLIVCDHKDCVKSYHPECVRKEESYVNTGEQWICDWHSCFDCHGSSRFQCICCPKAVCQSCISDADFAQVRGRKGLCGDCLKLALLLEENIDVDSDGEKVDFKDRETYEGLFMEYWEIINEKEGFALEDLHSADARLKKGEKYKPHSHKSSHSDSDEYNTNEEKLLASSDDYNSDEVEQQESDNKRNRSKSCQKRHKGSTKIEFVDWASKSLMEFLASIGIDTSEKVSQDDVVSIIGKYVQQNKLFHPIKKKQVMCDAQLRSVLGRRSVNIYKIKNLLEAHFPENLEHSEEEEHEYSLGEENDNVFLPSHKRKWWSVRSFQQKESASENFPKKETKCDDFKKEVSVFEVSGSCFASVIPRNIKLVYLKRSLVEGLLKLPEIFESKVVGSFVRVKSETTDHKRAHQLLQVTGIKQTSADETRKEVLLQLSNMPNDIPIHMLSNDNFSEEECEDLHQKIQNGLLVRPTVVELEKKARYLHEDITKHWITSELAFLKNRIDLRRKLLESPEEQARLLREVPKVIADITELKDTSENSLQKDSPVTLRFIDTPGEENGCQDSTSVLAKSCSVGPEVKGEGAINGSASENDAKSVATYRRRALRR